MSKPPITIVGRWLSPYVRKVLVCLDLKGIDYVVDPIVPSYGNDAFSRISPVRRIPVPIDGDLALCDSTVICEYLEDLNPEPRLRPADPVGRARARARWLEEYADTRLGDVFIWRLFNEVVIRRFVWGEKPDEEALRRTREIEIPAALDHLESEIPEGRTTFFDDFGLPDVSVAALFRNAAFAGFSTDAARWPRTAALVEHALAQSGFSRLRELEDLMLRTPIPRQREALAAAGAPVSPETFDGDSPRRGILPI